MVWLAVADRAAYNVKTLILGSRGEINPDNTQVYALGHEKGLIAMKSDRLLKWGFILPSIAVILLLMGYPIVRAIGSSFYTYMYGRAMAYAGIDNWIMVFHDQLFFHAIKITFAYSIIAIPIEMTIGTIIALIFYDLELHFPQKWISIFRSIIILPFIIMPTVTGIIWHLLFVPQYGLISYLSSKFGLPSIDWLGTTTGAMASVIIMDIWMWVPFIFIILLAGLEILPREPFEAAKVDGSSGWQTFRNVTLPLLKPSIIVALSLRTIDAIRI